MFLAGGQRAESALRQVPAALTYNRDEPLGSRSDKTSSPFHLHLLAQRLSQQLQFPDRSLSPKPSSPSTAVAVQPSQTPQEIPPRKRRPRHVPIVLSQAVISSVLRELPPSPKSPEFSPEASPRAPQGGLNADAFLSTKAPLRPRHIPIVIPDFAQPHGQFPPTPSTSAESTPRASPKPHSCELLYTKMSRPNTSGSRTSTIESNTSGLSPNQIYASRFKPPSSTYLAEMNSGSESSLNQANHDMHASNLGMAQKSMNHTEAPHASADDFPNATANPQSSTGSTHLSGLVCNVHRCTGREPLARVGATTTILGDKMYVFGGRILSRKQSMRVTADMYELDLIRRHWTKIETTGAIPKPRYFHTVCGLGDNKMICYGGMSPAPPSATTQPDSPQGGTDPMENMVVMSDIHVYDTIKRSWTHITTQDTPPGRYAHCAAVVPSTAIFTSANAPLSAIHHNPPSSVPNQGSLGVALDGSGGAEMIVVGGQDSQNKYIDAISVFNLRSLKWTDTKSLERSCGAYRSVVTPLVSMPASKIGAGLDQDEYVDAASGATERSDSPSSMLIYSNYNFLDVKLELHARLSDGSLVEKEMKGPVSPPGLRFPSGDILDNHFIVSGTYLTSSKHEYALWALDLKTLTWSRIDAGGGIFSQGSWNRGILWSRRNTFVILGNRKRVLVDDYNRRRINFSDICMVELEAFGLYDNPRRVWPTSNYTSISAPVLPASTIPKSLSIGGRPLPTAAVDLGLMAMSLRDLCDMDLIAINGERIPVNSYILSRRWGPYFNQLLGESSTSSAIQNDASSSSDGGTLRPSHLNPQSITSRNSSITITPSINTTNSTTTTSMTVPSSSASIISSSTNANILEPPNASSLPPSSRSRQLYLPHTIFTIRALVDFFYTSSLPPPDHELCTPQILCSLLQLARPYRVDGLLEATVERLHQVLDGRNAAAVFNAAAMAAGGGRGTDTPFGKEGELDLATLDYMSNGGGLTLNRLQASGYGTSTRANASHQYTQGSGPAPGAGENSEDSESVTSSSNSAPTASEAESGASTSASASATEDEEDINTPRGARSTRRANTTGASDEVWAGNVSCVVGLQKRGLRGLMEGRRMRERERGRTVGGLAANSDGAGAGVNGAGGQGSTGTANSATAAVTATGVGLGIA